MDKNDLMVNVSKGISELFFNIQLATAESIVKNVVPGFPKPEDGCLAQLRNTQVCFFRIRQLSFDENYPHREAFANVIRSLNDQAFNFVYLLEGSEEEIALYIGVVVNENYNESYDTTDDKESVPSAPNIGRIIEEAFHGNFNGSVLERISGDKLGELLCIPRSYKQASAIIGIPAINEKKSGDDYDFQGIDRLINSMLGLEWRLVIVCEPVGRAEIFNLCQDVYELYNRLSVCSKMTLQRSVNEGDSISFGQSVSEAKGRSYGHNRSRTTTKGRQDEHSNSGSSDQEGNSEEQNYNVTKGRTGNVSINNGSSSSITIEIANKHAAEMMKYIDEDLLKRLKSGAGKGLFKTAVYCMTAEPIHMTRLNTGLVSLFQGSESSYSPLYARPIDLKSDNGKNTGILQTYQTQYEKNTNCSRDALMLLSRPFYGPEIGLCSYLTTEEVSLLAGLPQKEVPGLKLKEAVLFGLNQKDIDGQKIGLGKMVQRGRDLTELTFSLSKGDMAKHTFIAGVTGSGKTTTCHKLLSAASTPFLVIEPAKTEYRALIGSPYANDLVVFTLGNETVAPFRINPFELVEGEVISAHIDMLKATFTSAFPMEASMPQLLEEAIISCYEKKGWDVNSTFQPGVNRFPILSDLLSEINGIVESKHFSMQMQSDYIGSLVSRLSNLTKGAKGSMLNCERSVDFHDIVHSNVVFEMEELKSPEDKALLMGLILSRLSAVIKSEHKENPNFSHLTLIEEAHRLLSKVDYGDSGARKSAVETFTDLLAEVRKYGEGLIIVDQIPNKLAPEVLKNTNTKIIHKLLAKDDKEVVGDTMLMDDKQKEYLSALEVGHAIVFSEHTDKPVHVHIEAVSNTSEAQVDDECVKRRFDEWRKDSKNNACYFELYELFETVVKEFSLRKVDNERCDALREQVHKTALKEHKFIKDLWRELIERRESVSGKAMESPKNTDERLTQLMEFFTEIFYRSDFNREDITVEISSYLTSSQK